LPTRSTRLVLMLLLAIPFWQACATRRISPTADPVQTQAENHLREGDFHLVKLHLRGWREAVRHYEQAFELNPTEEVRDKLLLALCLLHCREIDEQIHFTDRLSRIRELCHPNPSPEASALYELASAYGKRKPEAAVEGRVKLAFQELLLEGTAEHQYLFLLWLSACRAPELDFAKTRFGERHGSSPLAIYEGLAALPADWESAFPDFTELFLQKGETLFSTREFGKARDYYRKALELIPDHTRAIHGLAQVAFFALQDYEQALALYDASLKIDPHGVYARFGKGAALHHLGRYSESTLILDELLRSRNVRWEVLGKQQTDYFRGEAYYYKAYNCFLLNNREEARTQINEARRYRPRSSGICYLSGLLYFQAGEFDLAEAELLIVVKEGSANCGTPYHLGLIQNHRGNDQDVGYFLTLATCLQNNLGAFEQSLQEVEQLDLTSEEKAALRAKIETRKDEFRQEARSQMTRIVQLLERKDFENKELHVRLLKSVAERSLQ
jgi:tetratricopeptide (TPR) repeat protein